MSTSRTRQESERPSEFRTRKVDLPTPHGDVEVVTWEQAHAYVEKAIDALVVTSGKRPATEQEKIVARACEWASAGRRRAIEQALEAADDAGATQAVLEAIGRLRG